MAKRGQTAPSSLTRKTHPMQVDYSTLAKTIAALTENETDLIALMATVTCEVHHADTRFNWVGFYRVIESKLLKIGPYQGGHGCLTIPFSRGVCGAVARRLGPAAGNDKVGIPCLIRVLIRGGPQQYGVPVRWPNGYRPAGWGENRQGRHRPDHAES